MEDKHSLFDLCIILLSSVISISLILILSCMYKDLSTDLVLDGSYRANTYEGYIEAKNRVFEKRYDNYFASEEKVLPQYYIESAVYNQFVDKDKSSISDFTKNYMGISNADDLFNIAPSSVDVENTEYSYINSDTLLDDLEARYGASVRFDLDKSLLYSFIYKNIVLCDEGYLELYLNKDGVSEFCSDDYRVVFSDLTETGLYLLPKLDYKSSSLFNKDSTEVITNTTLSDNFGGVLVCLEFDCNPSYYEGVLFNLGNVKIYDKDSNALLVETTIRGTDSRLFPMINPFKRFDYRNWRIFGLN